MEDATRSEEVQAGRNPKYFREKSKNIQGEEKTQEEIQLILEEIQKNSERPIYGESTLERMQPGVMKCKQVGSLSACKFRLIECSALRKVFSREVILQGSVLTNKEIYVDFIFRGKLFNFTGLNISSLLNLLWSKIKNGN